MRLTFTAPDRAAEKNVGRQWCCLAEVGQYKAETIAARFNTTFGLQVCAITPPVAEASLEVPRNELL